MKLGTLANGFYATRAFGALAVLVIVVVPFLAENAVPGDVLYPVKIRFNEQVQSSLARTPYEKVAWETERLERRLAEARLLESEGKLTPEVEAEVAAAVKEHSDAAQEGIATLRASDSDEAAIAEITLSSALDVQSEMLEGGSAKLVSAVNTARQVAQDSQDTTTKPSYEKLLARIEGETTRAHELYETIADETTEKEYDDIGLRLRKIERGVATGMETSAGDSDAAVALLTTELGDLRKLISFMTNIDVRATVSVDDLIPTPQTPEDRAAMVATRIASSTDAVALLAPRIAATDANTRAAMSARLEEANGHLTAAQAAMAAEDIETADTESMAAQAGVTELLHVLGEYEAANGDTEPATSTATSTASSTSPEDE
jgi:hypothetical protein